MKTWMCVNYVRFCFVTWILKFYLNSEVERIRGVPRGVRYMYKSVSALHINISPAESISDFGTDSCIIKLAASHIQNPIFITKYVIKHYKIINNALYSWLVSTTFFTFYALSISLICFECFLILFYFFKTHSCYHLSFWQTNEPFYSLIIIYLYTYYQNV